MLVLVLNYFTNWEQVHEWEDTLCPELPSTLGVIGVKEGKTNIKPLKKYSVLAKQEKDWNWLNIISLQ